MGSREAETAYFALLRARDELAALHRYESYLREEAQRLRRVTSEGAALAEPVDPKVRRGLRHTDRPLEQAIRARLEAIAEELERLPDRTRAAEDFVADCEREHAELRG